MVEETLALLANLLAYGAGMIWGVLVRPGSYFSIWALAAGLLVAMAWYRHTARRKRSFGRLARLLVPRRYWASASARADWLLLILSHAVFASSFLALIINVPDLSHAVAQSLSAMTGTAFVIETDPMTARLATTAIAFLAYELAYFLDHWLKHQVKFLWEFHKVHHSATTLSPITLARMHPVDGYSYALLAIGITGSALGVCLWLFGPAANPFTVDGVNVILFAGVFTLMTLQHSHVWMPFRGWLGRTFLSPAHHQLHHSANPQHFNSNYGNVLAIWDWIFGTLREPARQSPRLRFGVDDIAYDPHTLHGLLLAPFNDAAAHLVPKQSGFPAQSRPATDKL